jgi:hypothetical protein
MPNESTDPAAGPTHERLERVARALRANNLEAIIVETGAEARRLILELIPAGAEVFSAASKTLEEIGLLAELQESGRYDLLRTRYRAMDRATQGREIRKLIAAPDFMLGSVHAVTEEGTLVTASYSASQLGPYASGAGRLLLVVGIQKIVPDLDAALRRIREVVVPYEDARLRVQLGVGTKVAKILITYLDPMPGRTTVFLVREPVGV